MGTASPTNRKKEGKKEREGEGTSLIISQDQLLTITSPRKEKRDHRQRGKRDVVSLSQSVQSLAVQDTGRLSSSALQSLVPIWLDYVSGASSVVPYETLSKLALMEAFFRTI